MSEAEEERDGSVPVNEMENRDTSASRYSTVATATSESGPHDIKGSEMVSGHRTWSEIQSVEESAGPVSGTRPPTTSGNGATKGTQRQMPSTQTRDTPVIVAFKPAADSQGDAHAMRESVEIPQPSDLLSSKTGIQEQVNQNKGKRGICILCACINAWSAQERIEPCDAVERMRQLFEDKLGYLVIQVGTTTTSQHLDEVLQELEKIELPPSYRRVFFYYFGHGTEEALCLADRDVERKHIIGRLQSMCPSHPELFKIFLFDSCRTISLLTAHPVQEHKKGRTGVLGGGGGGHMWQAKWRYPSSSNTLVINATDFNCKAYYIDDAQVHGCGLVTLYFTDLAPKMNLSLSELLAEVRTKVVTYIKTHPDDVQRCAGHHYVPQVLVYEDRLMGRVNLLAESTGNARLAPEKVTANPQALNTNVQWRFPSNVEDRIQRFIVKVTSDGDEEEQYVLTDHIERFATLSLKPSTTYHLKVVAEYDDSFRAESAEIEFTTSDRSSPENVKITPHYSTSQEAIVEWSFPGDISELAHYIVKAEVDGKPKIKETIHDVQLKRFILKQVHLRSKYIVTIIAVYRDGIEKESTAEFFSECDLRAATNMSTTVIHLDDPLKVKVEWSHPRVENAPFPTGFIVVAQADNSSITQMERVGIYQDGTPQTERVENLSIYKAELELNHDTTYSLKVITIYGENTKLESEDIEFKTPSKDEEKPTVRETEKIRRHSVEITFFDPQFLQKPEYGDCIWLRRYTVKYIPHGEETNEELPYDVNTPTSDTTPNQPRRMKLLHLMPGKKYKLTVTANYSNGESIASEEQEFTTKSAVPQNVCLCIIISILLFAFALLAFSYAPYHHYLQGSEDCQVSYILSTDAIQCGYGNSLQYDRAEIKGCPVNGDEMTETLNVWQIHASELKLYFQTLPPENSAGQTTEHSTFLLMGWQIYTWKNSVIAGFCCIANDNEEEKTASLHMFRHDEDAYRFEHGEGVRNAILSEQISVPPKKTSCFRKWGTNSPFTVTHSSYHYIGVDLPVNMNYTANITVTQSYVNVSDYPKSKPKQFRRDNHTHFTYPHTWFHGIDYLYICKAPLIYPEHKSKPDSVSLHACTCNEPYSWMKPFFTSITVLGVCGFLIIPFVVTCCCLRKKRQSICANYHSRYCPCFRDGYRPINSQQTTVQA